MVLGILAMPADEVLTSDEREGLIVLSILAIVFASVALGKHHRGRGMAIAGLVLGILVLLFAIGAD